MGKNIAIKCTYNNGGEGYFVGFNGTCSVDNIKSNIEKGRVWCSQKQCECRKYYNRGFKGEKPYEPCYESTLFKNWRFGAGTYHTGKRAGTPIHLWEVEKGKIAILTTLFPGDPEINRRIIGFFKIGKVEEGEGVETVLFGEKPYCIRLPLEEARELYFWDYYNTKGGARWGSGIVRYLDDSTIKRILIDLQETLRDEKAKLVVNYIVDNDFKDIKLILPKGPRTKKGSERKKRIAVNRKYGFGGEGEEHKKLKKWVKDNPGQLGINGVVYAKDEYIFPSGDTVDVYFERSGNKFTVVEIETVWPEPGFYQALKYKVLKCAEARLDIKSADVDAVLVAWSIPAELRKLCRKYGVRCVEKKI